MLPFYISDNYSLMTAALGSRNM